MRTLHLFAGAGIDGARSGLWREVVMVAARVDRIRALGNGQVPLQAAAAYLILDGRLR